MPEQDWQRMGGFALTDECNRGHVYWGGRPSLRNGPLVSVEADFLLDDPLYIFDHRMARKAAPLEVNPTYVFFTVTRWQAQGEHLDDVLHCF